MGIYETKVRLDFIMTSVELGYFVVESLLEVFLIYLDSLHCGFMDLLYERAECKSTDATVKRIVNMYLDH